MPISINGSGTITGINAGGLPDTCTIFTAGLFIEAAPSTMNSGGSTTVNVSQLQNSLTQC